MKRFLVLVTDHINDDLGPERELLADLADVRALDAHDESELVGQIDEADALMVYHNVALSVASLSRLKHCRLIVRVGVGYDNVDGELARQKAIPLVNIPDYGTEEVADSAIGMILTDRVGDGSYLTPRSDDTNRAYAVDGRWGIGENLLLEGWFARTDTPGLDSDDQAFSARVQ